MAAATTTSEGMATVDEVGVAIQQQEQPDTQHEEQAKEPGLCCHYLRRGKCITPRPPCLLRHEPDDGIRPCFFGATCRNGHRNRVLGGMTTDDRLLARIQRPAGKPDRRLRRSGRARCHFTQISTGTLEHTAPSMATGLRLRRGLPRHGCLAARTDHASLVGALRKQM
jgi:hypothetical protein